MLLRRPSLAVVGPLGCAAMMVLAGLSIFEPSIAAADPMLFAATGPGETTWVDYTFGRHPAYGFGAIGVLVTLIPLAFLLRGSLMKEATRRALLTPKKWDDALTKAISRSVFWGLVAFAPLLATYLLTAYYFDASAVGAIDIPGVTEPAKLPGRVWQTALLLYLLFVLIQAVEIVGAFIEDMTARTESQIDDTLAKLARRTLQSGIVVVALILLVDAIGASTVAILAGLGILILVVVLFAYDAIRNASASFQMLADSPFRTGDVIRFGETVGTVKRMGLRATVLETPGRSTLSVPNFILGRAAIENLSYRPTRREEVTLDLPRSADRASIERLLESLREILEDEEAVSRRAEARDAETDEPVRDGETGRAVVTGVDPLVALASIEPHGLRVLLRYDLAVLDYASAMEIQQSLLLRFLAAVEDAELSLVGPGLDGDALQSGAVAFAEAMPAGSSTKRAASGSRKKAATKKKKSATKKKKAASKSASTGNAAEADDDEDA